MTAVDFVMNCYERTYRDVLRPGYVSEVAGSQGYRFGSITVLVNNVAERADAEVRAKRLLAEDSSVGRVLFVSDHLGRALRTTGLRHQDLRRAPHFSDCALVAVTLDGPDWLVYWDADVRLVHPGDWVDPTLKAIEADARLVVGNPNWAGDGSSEREALWRRGDFGIGYGFSDQVFLARRSELGRPIYRNVAPASWRYPMAHIEPVFEQRVDAWMRRTGRLRTTFLPVTYFHPDHGRTTYPPERVVDRVRRPVYKRLEQLAGRMSSHPAMRA